LTREQQQRVDSWIGVCRLVYNMALDLKIQAYQKNIPLSFYDLQKQLPDLKNIDWIADAPSACLIAVIQKLERTYKNFFSGRSNFPKFKSKKDAQSIYFKANKAHKNLRQVSGNSFRLPKIGNLRVYNDRPIHGEITGATIKKVSGKYYLLVSCTAEQQPLPHNENQVGVDVGLSNFAILSNGSFVAHPRTTFKYQAELRRQQRKLSRCKRFGKNWYKQLVVIQKLHQKIRNSRLDFLHKTTSDIVRNNGLISVEKLNIRGLVKSRLAKHISDSGWYEFRQQIKYKSELYGRLYFEVAPNYSSQECFSCGHTEKDNRQSQSIFICVKCGHEDHADLNASKNLLRRGQRLLAQSTDTSLRLAKEVA
jgi:putative transposase